MIKQRNLSLISNRLAAESEHRVAEDVIERDYVLAWFLSCYAHDALNGSLAFKGGTCLRRCWIEQYRFSEDLDFTIVRELSQAQLEEGFVRIFDAVLKQSGIKMDFRREDSHQNTHVYVFEYSGPMPTVKPKRIKVDVTISEKVCLPLVQRPVLKTFPEFDDLDCSGNVNCYSIEEVVVEKLVALSDKARTEPRDLYDLWFLTENHGIHLGELTQELKDKLAHRNRTIEGIQSAIEAKEKRLEAAWEKRLAHQVLGLPAFGDVFRETMRFVRAAHYPTETFGM